ncbi:Cystine/glutamate transporter [Holothuria leucospilota]|uniref:Cystine/glutamate transporter n=1 Tax=Holothuria leucospilota TaxID=206669 RepID=A0A9Q1BQG0_HOLLE|nr:Cystine/glutamate transporter [Holothuria leucospilota]
MESKDNVATNSVALGRVLGFLPSIAFIVGVIIGTGIFVSPTGVLRGVNGSIGWAFAIWIACGLIAMCGALSYMELTSSFTKSGGEFIFIKESFGPAIAFLRVWTVVAILGPGTLTFQSMVIANYLITPFVDDCSKSEYYTVIRLIAACVMCFIIFINSFSVSASSLLQSVLTVAKLIGLAILILTGAVLLFQGYTDNFRNPFVVNNFNPGLLPGAFYSGIFAYAGWDYISFVTEEIKKPERTVRAMVGSMTFIIIVYLLANVAYLTALTPNEILSSDAVAATFAVRVLKRWSWTIWIFVALSAAGNLNGGTFTRCRMYFVAAREGYLPEFMSMIHVRWRTPLPALAVLLPVSFLFLLVEDLFILIEVIESVDTAFNIITVAIIPYFRWKQPDRPASYKVPLFMPIIFILFNMMIIFLYFYSSPLRSCLGLMVTLFGLVLYFFGCKWTSKPKSVQNAIDSTNIFIQKLFLSVRQEVKTY